MSDPDARDSILNLHDAYLNTNLVRTLMEQSPCHETDPQPWLVSDRARLERLWWALTYVLIEAWEAADTKAQAIFNRCPSTPKLASELSTLRDAGVIDEMRECRHYMCHRDRRAYWDRGRLSAVGHLQEVRQLHMTFGDVFLEAFAELKNRSVDEERVDD